MLVNCAAEMVPTVMVMLGSCSRFIVKKCNVALIVFIPAGFDSRCINVLQLLWHVVINDLIILNYLCKVLICILMSQYETEQSSDQQNLAIVFLFIIVHSV